MTDKLSEQILDEARKLPGLVEHLKGVLRWQGEYESKGIEDVKVDEESGTAAYILNYHQWGSSGGGIGMKAILELYVNGEGRYLRSDIYRDKWDPRKDNWGVCWRRIKKFEVTGEKGVLVVSSAHIDKEFSFEI